MAWLFLTGVSHRVTNLIAPLPLGQNCAKKNCFAKNCYATGIPCWLLPIVPFDQFQIENYMYCHLWWHPTNYQYHWIQIICYYPQECFKYLPSCLLSSRDRYSYFKEWMNLFDCLGLLLILCIIPLRYCDSNAQWMVASLALLFNCLRIFKFSCLTR